MTVNLHHHLRHHLCRHLHHHLRRSYSTKYSGRVVLSSNDGLSFAVEITPPVIPSDPRGYPLPRRDLICKSLKLLKSNPNNLHSLFEYLQTLTLPLSPSEASLILKSINPPTLALQFFRFCPSHIPGFRHDVFTFNRMLHILSEKGVPNCRKVVGEIVDDMERSGMKGNISTVNILIRVLGGEGEGDGEGDRGVVKELERCLGFVKKWELNLNNYTYKCLLQAYLRLGDLSKGVKVYKEMRRRSYKLDIYAYNVFLDALVEDGKVVCCFCSS